MTDSSCSIMIPDYIGTLTPTDNCSAVVEAQDIPAGAYTTGVSDGAVIVVHYTATDGASPANTTTCTVNITVNDDDPPQVVCPPADITINTDDGLSCSIMIPDYVGTLTAVDNCSAVVEAQDIPAGAYSTGVSHGAVIVVNYTATDAATPANTTTCTVNITVNDDDPPTVTSTNGDGFADIKNYTCNTTSLNINSDPSTCVAFRSVAKPTWTDNCDMSLSLTQGALKLPATVVPLSNAAQSVSANFPVGTNVVTFTATDDGGNASTCSLTIVVADNQPPVLTMCPSSPQPSVNTLPGTCAAPVNWLPPNASDNCTGVSITVTGFSPANSMTPYGGVVLPGSSFPAGTYTIVYTATDGSGLTSSCTFNIEVKDNQAPVVSDCPSNINTGTDAGVCTAVVTWTEPTALDNCDGPLVYDTRSHAPGATFASGTTTVMYTFMDAAGNTTPCSFDVIVTDDEAPVVSGCPSDINTGTDAGVCTAVVTWTEPTALDNCDGPLVYDTRSHAPGATFASGTTTVTYTFMDAAGNTTPCSFDVIVTDDEAPVVSGCPSDINTGTDAGVCTAVVTWTEPTALDNCDGPLVYDTRSHAPGATFASGTTTVTYTFMDAAGNTTPCSFDVIVTDDEAPVVSGCPSDINTGTDAGVCTAVVTWTEPTALDNCDGPLVYDTRSHAPGATFASGTTTVTYTFMDAAGNTTPCSFDVIVTDDEAPVVSGCPSDINTGTDAGVCTAVVTWTEPTALDNCDGPLSYDTRSHAPGATFASGTTTVTYTFMDAAGNTTPCSFDVIVTDDEAPVVSGCPSDINTGTDAGVCTAVVTWTEPTALDNCDGPLVYDTRSHAPGATFASGTTTVTYTFMDAAGNTTPCSFDVIVTDDESPVVSACPSDINTGTDAGVCTAVVTWTEPTALDNCDGPLVYDTRSHAPGATFASGTTTVTYTFMDAAGNTTPLQF
ncbi:MAG: HYR domain-containing protein [Lewinellaceae bacterium]|nr:HYR domain-containing protein [Lewinellaceae bacterium]